MIFAPNKPAKGRAPIPEKLPGTFFVLEYDREDKNYTLHVDDEARSSFDLGSDVDDIRAHFTSRGLPLERVNDFIDRAREFGTCQYIPCAGTHVEDRVIQILPREARSPVPNLFGEPANGTWNHGLR